VRTSELATRAAVNPQTLRYYERRGLLTEPARSPAGYRAYPAEALRRVRFIKRAQELGFTLSQVQTLLHLAEEKPADLRRRITDLQASQAGLTRLVATCEGPRPQRDCPILHELDPPTPGLEADGGRR
jgi:DNA-binding transcriptional MerR regulator